MGVPRKEVGTWSGMTSRLTPEVLNCVKLCPLGELPARWIVQHLEGLAASPSLQVRARMRSRVSWRSAGDLAIIRRSNARTLCSSSGLGEAS